jgi:hypothetical protein
MEVSAQLHVPAALLPGKTRDTHWIGGSVDSRAGLDVLHLSVHDILVCAVGARTYNCSALSAREQATNNDKEHDEGLKTDSRGLS